MNAAHHLAPALAGFALFGAALGAAHFATLAVHVRALLRGGGIIAATAPLLRFVVTGAGLVFAARHGAPALAAATAGFLAARAGALRIPARQP